MDDLISRQAAIDELCDNCDNVKSVCPHYPCKQYTAIEQLPSAQPERKKGKWIDGNEGKWNSVYCPKCSVCGTPFYGIETVRYHYCPNCGTRMEV